MCENQRSPIYMASIERKKPWLSLPEKKHVTRIAYNKKQNLDTIMYYEKKNLEATWSKKIEKTQPDL